LKNKLKFVGQRHKQAVENIIAFLEPEDQPVFLVTGDPGMGKSRVLDEFMGHKLFDGDSRFVKKFIVHPDETIEPLLMFWLEDLLSKISLFKGNEKRWRGIVKAIPQFGPGLELFFKDTSKPSKQKFLEALCLVSDKLDEDERLVILIDPWVDLGTHENAEVIEHFVSECPPKIKFIVAQRKDDLLATSSKFQRLVRRNKVELIKLEQKDVVEVLCDDPRLCKIDEKDRADFSRKTGGWPLALASYARDLESATEDAASVIARMPDDLKTDIVGKYMQLSPDSRKVIDTLSLLDMAADFSTLAALTEMDKDILSSVVDSTDVGKLIEIIEDNQGAQLFRMRHALYAEWIVKRLKAREIIADRYQKISIYFKSRFDEDNKRAQDLIHHLNFLYLCEDKQAFIEGVGGYINIIHRMALYEAVLDLEQKRLAIFREIGDRAGEGTTLNNISQVYRAWGKNDEALKYLKESLAISREIGDRAGEAVTCFNIACIYEQQGRIKEAVELVEITVEIDRQTQHPDLESDTTYLNSLKAKL